MNNFFDYLIKVNLVFTVLYLVYILLLRKNTFHNLNRLVLLSILITSIVLPVITIDFSFINIDYSSQLPILNNQHFSNGDTPLSVENEIEGSNFSINEILSLIYTLGCVVLLSRLFYNLIELIKVKKVSSKKIDGKYLLIYSKIPAYFSFFNWIFIPVEKKDSQNISIINHEKIHSNKKHSVDLLLTEVFKALLWFNPFVYFFQKNLKTVHEYQVDSAVLKNESLTSYLQTILDNLPYQNKTKIYNYFGELSIKKRVNMITKNKSSKWNLIRYTILLPIIGLLLMSFNIIENIPSILPIKKGEYHKIASQFGMRHHPILKTKRMHNGIDFAAKIGTEIRATADGVVTFADINKGYGKMILIKHDNTYETLYSQMKDFNVSKGQKVKKGDIIGYVGISGNSSGPHLHYEVRKNKKNVDPEDYFTTE